MPKLLITLKAWCFDAQFFSIKYFHFNLIFKSLILLVNFLGYEIIQFLVILNDKTLCHYFIHRLIRFVTPCCVSSPTWQLDTPRRNVATWDLNTCLTLPRAATWVHVALGSALSNFVVILLDISNIVFDGHNYI